jgi:putative membrane protein
MKNKILFPALIVAACAFQACQNANKNSNDADSLSNAMVDSANMAVQDTGGINNNDTSSFMHKAAIGGMMEVELGNLAQKQASNAQVREFGAMMVKDHSKANAELKNIADMKKIMLPTTYPEKEQKHIDAMKNMKGAEFDKHYMSMMVDDHEKDISLFKAATKDNDTSISKFATKTLPVLVTHHKRATTINSSLKK